MIDWFLVNLSNGLTKNLIIVFFIFDTLNDTVYDTLKVCNLF